MARISELTNHQTIIKSDFEFYHMLMESLLYFNNLSLVRVMLKIDKISEWVEKLDLENNKNKLSIWLYKKTINLISI